MLTGAQLRDPRIGKEREKFRAHRPLPQEYGRWHQICYRLVASQPANFCVHDWEHCQSIAELRVLTLTNRSFGDCVHLASILSYGSFVQFLILGLRLWYLLCSSEPPDIDSSADVMDDRCRWKIQGFEPLRQRTLI